MNTGKNLDLFWQSAYTQCGSMYQLAKMTGLDESNLSKMRHGKRPLTVKTIARVCDILHINPWSYAIEQVMVNEPTMRPFTLSVR
jgi:DNA-binding Xre family transcriptional regulator